MRMEVKLLEMAAKSSGFGQDQSVILVRGIARHTQTSARDITRKTVANHIARVVALSALTERKGRKGMTTTKLILIWTVCVLVQEMYTRFHERSSDAAVLALDSRTGLVMTTVSI